MFQTIAIAAGVVLGQFGLGVAGIVWWLHWVFAYFEEETEENWQ